MPALVMRVDADAHMGHGHLTRCLALAEGWDGPVLVATARACPDAVSARIAAAGARPSAVEADAGSDADARVTAALARASGAAWVVVDGYQFGDGYQRALASAGLRLLCVDDNGEAGVYVCDLVLNQNLHADESLYRWRAPHTRLLLGPRFVLLRRAFLEAGQPVRRFDGPARQLLVTLGGGEAGPALLIILDALAALRLPDLAVTVIAGAGNGEVEARASRIRGSVTLLERTDMMPALMASADLAISAGGSTSWELAYMGLPAAVVTMAANQAGAVGALVGRGLAADLGRREKLDAAAAGRLIDALARDPERRAQMSAAGRALVDGGGVHRVVRALRSRPNPATQASIGAGQKDTQ